MSSYFKFKLKNISISRIVWTSTLSTAYVLTKHSPSKLFPHQVIPSTNHLDTDFLSHCVRENDLRQPVSWRFPGKLPTVSWANRFPQPCSPICYLLYWITNHCYLRLLSLRGNLPSLRASIFSHSSPANFHPTESSSRCLANSRFYDVASTTLISIVESVSIFVSPVEHQHDGLIQ